MCGGNRDAWGHLGTSWGHLGTRGDTNLLVLQLTDGGLGALQVLGGRGAALLHHRQLPLDDVVLLCLLRPCHLALGTAGDVSPPWRGVPGSPPPTISMSLGGVWWQWRGQGGDAGDMR